MNWKEVNSDYAERLKLYQSAELEVNLRYGSALSFLTMAQGMITVTAFHNLMSAFNNHWLALGLGCVATGWCGLQVLATLGDSVKLATERKAKINIPKILEGYNDRSEMVLGLQQYAKENGNLQKFQKEIVLNRFDGVKSSLWLLVPFMLLNNASIVQLMMGGVFTASFLLTAKNASSESQEQISIASSRFQKLYPKLP